VLRLVGVLLFALAAAASGAELKPWSGGPTPALELEDMTGQTHRLADYRGKVVLVNFWATWCEPCRAEMPSIDGLRSALDGKPFQVLAVNLAEPVSRIEKFMGMMNARITQLGLTDSHFVTPHGLDAKDHYSSAYDLASFTWYALHLPVFTEVVK